MAGAFVQSTTDSGQKSTLTFVLPAPITTGNTLVLAVAGNNRFGTPAPDGAPPPTLGTAPFYVPVGGGVTWNTVYNGAGPEAWQQFALWFGTGSTGGTTTITVANIGVQSGAGKLFEFSGVSPILTQPDATGTLGNPNNSPPPQAPVATTWNADLVFGVWTQGSTVASPSVPLISGGYNDLGNIWTTLHGTQYTYESILAAAWRNTTLAGTYTPLWTTNNAAPWQAIGLALKLVGATAALQAVDSGKSGDFVALTALSNITVPAAVFNIPDRHIFGGVDLSTFAVMQVRSSGGDSHPALRGENPAWAGLPGTQSLEQLPNSRIYNVDLFVHGMTAAGGVSGTEEARARANLDSLQTILARGVEQPLIRVMPDGTGRQAMAKVWNVQEIDGRLGNALFALHVEFYLSDPWFYSSSVIDSNRALSSTAVSFSLTHPGTVRGHHVLFDLLGPMTNPRITNLTTGTNVQYTGVIGNNQRLLIDVEHFSAFLGGANVVGYITHAGGVPFMWVAPGVNSFLVETTASGGTLTTTFSPSYI